MTIRPIRNSNDHRTALKRIEALMSAQSGTAEGDELDVLGTLVDAYERAQILIHLPDPIEAIKFRRPDRRSNTRGSRSTRSQESAG